MSFIETHDVVGMTCDHCARAVRTELSAIVAPAIIGFSRPAAASGSAATLYPNAHTSARYRSSSFSGTASQRRL